MEVVGIDISLSRGTSGHARHRELLSSLILASLEAKR